MERDKVVPIFQAQWEPEFREHNYKPFAILSVLLIGIIYSLLIFMYEALGLQNSSGSDSAGGSFGWRIATVSPYLAISVVYVVIIVVMRVQRWRPFCVHHIDTVCALKIIFTYGAVIVSRVLLDVRRAIFERTDVLNIDLRLDAATFPVHRICKDSDPIRTMELASRGDSDSTIIGCTNSLLSGGILATYAFLNLLPVMYRMKALSSVAVTLVNDLIIIFALLATGTYESTMLSFLAFQTVTGAVSAYFCHHYELLARQQFTMIKATRFASEKNANLLFTLLPKNVLLKLNSSNSTLENSNQLIGASIPWCTVMFCCLEPDEELCVLSEEKFDLRNKVFCEFDRAVQNRKLFKYQHVASYYIVACQRASIPFEDEQQAKEYPMMEYVTSMVSLAQELCVIAARFKVHDQPLWLRVGINGGPCAGAAIGCHRSFYCLYGNTVNVAARMCKKAVREGPIRCTREFRDEFYMQVQRGSPELQPERCAHLQYDSCGDMEVKGKGHIEVFDIRIIGILERVVISAANTAAAAAAGGGPVMAAAAAAQRSGSGDRKRGGGRRKSIEIIQNMVVETAARFRNNSVTSLTDGVLTRENMRWLRDPQRSIDRFIVKFKDPEYEKLFNIAHSPATRHALIAGLAVHVCTFACQWNLAIYPEYTYNYAALGAHALHDAIQRVRVILSVNFGVMSGYCAFLIFLAMRMHMQARTCQKHYAFVKVVHMAISIYTFCTQPALWGLILSFSYSMICLHGALSTLTFRMTLFLVLSSFLGFCISLSIVHGAATWTLCKAFALGFASVLIAHITNFKHRTQWRINFLLETELKQVKDKLFDLLPPNIAQTMIETSGYVPCERGEAAILQLDICGFTAMSSDLHPMEVAAIIHHLFCIFDRAVMQSSGLYKTDTIGDAYIIAAILPKGAPQHERSRLCRELLQVAKVMIEAMEDARTKMGWKVDCRIGIAIGPVLTGVLGVLQPRFHVYGPAIQFAEVLEQSAPHGHVHVSAIFLQEMGVVLTAQDIVIDIHANGGSVPGWRVVNAQHVHVPENLLCTDEDELELEELTSETIAVGVATAAEAEPSSASELHRVGEPPPQQSIISFCLCFLAVTARDANGGGGGGEAATSRGITASAFAGSISRRFSAITTATATSDRKLSLPKHEGLGIVLTPVKVSSEIACVQRVPSTPGLGAHNAQDAASP